MGDPPLHPLKKSLIIDTSFSILFTEQCTLVMCSNLVLVLSQFPSVSCISDFLPIFRKRYESHGLNSEKSCEVKDFLLGSNLSGIHNSIHRFGVLICLTQFIDLTSLPTKKICFFFVFGLLIGFNLFLFYFII